MANEFNIKRGFISNGNSTVNGKLTTQKLTITSGVTSGYVLTSDASGNATWQAPASTSGKFGIADSNGVYTYYSTLTLAMTAAVAGQTVEFFTDYTESGNVTISMKDGVNINGNGHTYTCTYSGGAIAIFQNTTGTQTISDLTIVGSGMNSSSQGFIITYTAQKTFFNGVVIKMDTGIGAYVYGAATIDGLITNVSASAKGFYVDSGTIINCRSYSISGYAIQLVNPSYSYNCFAYSLNTSAFYNNGGQLYDCVGNGNIGIELQGGSAYNCVGKSSTGYGIYVQPSSPSQVVNCTAISTASWGMFQYNNNSLISNCNIISTAANAIYSQFVSGNRYVNNYISSTSAIAFRSVASGTNNLYNNTIYSSWNNAGGHALEISVSNDILSGNVFEVTNTSANCLYAGGAYTTKYSDTKFVGATTPVNANITQGVTNTQDAYGNITI